MRFTQPYVKTFSLRRLRDYRLTRREEISDSVVALCEGVEDPAAAGEEPLVVQVVVVGQRPEAVHPQTHPLNLGSQGRLTIGVARVDSTQLKLHSRQLDSTQV